MNEVEKIAIVSGGFDPLHSGHIAYLEAASRYGDELWVCLNSDDWLTAKKGKPFMPFHERKALLMALRCVNRVIGFDDEDGSCKKGIQQIAFEKPNAELFFCNGGDRTLNNIPEASIEGVNLIFGVGGKDKKNSSSNILQAWNLNTEQRSWGQFTVLLTKANFKIKQLIVSPHQGMSFQRHKYRSEIWFVQEGSCEVFLELQNSSHLQLLTLKSGDILEIPIMAKHQVINNNKEPCIIIEFQRGERVDEYDIERFFYFPKTP